jgi:hypothetical protein
VATTSTGYSVVYHCAGKTEILRSYVLFSVRLAHCISCCADIHNQGVYTAADLKRIYDEENGPFNLTAINGDYMIVDYDAVRDILTIDGGDIFIANIKGVDG